MGMRRRARELAIALGWLDVCLGLIPLIGLGLQLALSYESDEGFVDLALPLAASLALLGIGAFKIRVLSHPQTGKAMLREREEARKAMERLTERRLDPLGTDGSAAGGCPGQAR